ncbi:MAG: CoA binding domain protein [Pelotomaculum sp. PtaB.Bin104]|nr:MAG: CoA binding domain protein [Pelotomaculum sp. PtaB.Bin104]
MVTQAAVQDFLSQKTLAVIGVSRSKNKFSYRLYQELKAKGYQVFPVNPHMAELDGEPCFDSIKSIPHQVDGAVLVTPSGQTEKVIGEVIATGVRQVWIQQGAESAAAIAACARAGLNAIHHECLLMFAEPAGFPHNAHRFIWRVLGKMPK